MKITRARSRLGIATIVVVIAATSILCIPLVKLAIANNAVDSVNATRSVSSSPWRGSDYVGIKAEFSGILDNVTLSSIIRAQRYNKQLERLSIKGQAITHAVCDALAILPLKALDIRDCTFEACAEEAFITYVFEQDREFVVQASRDDLSKLLCNTISLEQLPTFSSRLHVHGYSGATNNPATALGSARHLATQEGLDPAKYYLRLIGNEGERAYFVFDDPTSLVLGGWSHFFVMIDNEGTATITSGR